MSYFISDMKTQEKTANYLAQQKLDQIITEGLPKALSLIARGNNELEHIIVDGHQYLVWTSALDGIYDNDEITVSVDIYDGRDNKYKKFISSIIGKEHTFKKTFRESQPRQEDTQECTYKKDSAPDPVDPAGIHYPAVIQGIPVSLDQIHTVLRAVEGFLSDSSEKTVYLLVEQSILLKNRKQYKNLERILPVKVVQSKVYRTGWLRLTTGVCTFLLELKIPRGILEVFYTLLTRSIDAQAVSDVLGISYGVFSSQSAPRVIKEITDRYDTNAVSERRIGSFVGINELDELDPTYFAYSVVLSLCKGLYDDCVPPIEFSSHGPNAPPALVDLAAQG